MGRKNQAIQSVDEPGKKVILIFVVMSNKNQIIRAARRAMKIFLSLGVLERLIIPKTV